MPDYPNYHIGLRQNISPMYDLQDYLSPINVAEINDDTDYNDSQMGSILRINQEYIPDLEGIDIVFVGINEYRGEAALPEENSADAIRKQFYRLHYWHQNVQMADIGNVKIGASLKDSYHVLKIVLKELLELNKTVVIIGGSHDITLAQYYAYKDIGNLIDATVVDAIIDLK
ncbi:MAG: arginase family protein, partial [Ginsengibacter sp.]